MILLPFLAAAAVAGAHPAALVGAYDGHQMEIAAGLTLKADGHFSYALAYGALDEEARGTWEARDGRVLLTTRPAVIPPRFVVVQDEPVITGGLFVTLADPHILQGSRLKVVLFYGPMDRPQMTETDTNGRVRLPDSRRPGAFQPLLPVYDRGPHPIPLTGKSGHRITVRFEPHDLGKADFRSEPLVIEGNTLILPRYGRELRFRRH